MSTDSVRLTETTLVVTGMTCGHCVSAVRSLVLSVPGVTVRTLSLGVAVIAAPDASSISSVIQALAGAGYCATVVRPASSGNACTCGANGCGS